MARDELPAPERAVAAVRVLNGVGEGVADSKADEVHLGVRAFHVLVNNNLGQRGQVWRVHSIFLL